MTQVPPEPNESSPGNMFTQKYGPLPAWGWLALFIVLYFLYTRYKSSKSGTSTSGTSSGTSSTGTNNALSSNLVGVSQPTPVLDGTYQVTVSPENAPNSVYSDTTNSSTQGIGSNGVASGSLQAASAPANPGTNLTAQTQPSSPQTQATPTTG